MPSQISFFFLTWLNKKKEFDFFFTEENLLEASIALKTFYEGFKMKQKTKQKLWQQQIKNKQTFEKKST